MSIKTEFMAPEAEKREGARGTFHVEGMEALANFMQNPDNAAATPASLPRVETNVIIPLGD